MHSFYKSNETNKWQKINNKNRSKYLGSDKMIENKFQKNVTLEDIKSKIPLVAKKQNHKSKFKISGVEFGGKKINFRRSKYG